MTHEKKGETAAERMQGLLGRTGGPAVGGGPVRKEWRGGWITDRRYLRVEPEEQGFEEQDGSDGLLLAATRPGGAVVPQALGSAHPGLREGRSTDKRNERS